MRRSLLALSLIAAAPLSAAWTSHGPIGGQVRGLPAQAATLAIDAGNVLHAGTDARGVWELEQARRRAARR